MSAKKPALRCARLLTKTRGNLGTGVNDEDITGYNKVNSFIVACSLDEQTGPWTASYYLYWRNVTDAGSFAALASTGQCKWASDTDLTQGTAVTSTTRACGTFASHTWQDGEEVEGSNLSDSINIADEYYTEVHFAVSLADGHAGDEYEFQVWENNGSSSVGTLLCTITLKKPTITDAGDEDFYNGETGIVITGTGFEASKGAGKVELSNNSTYGSGTLVEQTTTSWGDTSITFTCSRGALSFGTLYLFVKDNNGDASAAYTVAIHRIFNDVRQDIINHIDSAQSEAHGWDVERANIPVTDVVRTSSTVVTITLSALSAYDITAQETVTVTAPSEALTGGSDVVATPTFTITQTGGVSYPMPESLNHRRQMFN